MADRGDFATAFKLLIGHEGVYSDDYHDRGNWTSGAVGTGTLKGTKYGVSAHAYPALDIKNLTLPAAHDIYWRDYWSRAGCDLAPPRLAFVLFDGAVNNGVAASVRWLQTALGAAADGVFGPATARALGGALARRGEDFLVVEVLAHRLRFMVELPGWKNFRGGWSRRLVKVAYEAADNWPLTQA